MIESDKTLGGARLEAAALQSREIGRALLCTALHPTNHCQHDAAAVGHPARLLLPGARAETRFRTAGSRPLPAAFSQPQRLLQGKQLKPELPTRGHLAPQHDYLAPRRAGIAMYQ